MRLLLGCLESLRTHQLGIETILHILGDLFGSALQGRVHLRHVLLDFGLFGRPLLKNQGIFLRSLLFERGISLLHVYMGGLVDRDLFVFGRDDGERHVLTHRGPLGLPLLHCFFPLEFILGI